MNSVPPNDQTSSTKEKGFLNEYRSIAPFLTLGIQLAAAVVAFFFLGYWIDLHFGVSPAGKLIGLFLGCIGGFYKFFKTIASLEKQIGNEQK
jgi:F0F1-type ATP synthase assembly protein I